MSFQSTHLHFADEIKNILLVKDLTRYFSGALYPDSRYITKIDRDKTHSDVKLSTGKIINLKDDFHKGWQAHLIYDQLGINKLKMITLEQKYKPDEMKKEEIWIPVTAAKLVEDLYWWENTDWTKITPHLKTMETPVLIRMATKMTARTTARMTPPKSRC